MSTPSTERAPEPKADDTPGREVVDTLVRERVNRAVLKKIGQIIAEDADHERRTRRLVGWLLGALALATCAMAWYGFPAVAYRIQKVLAAETPGILSHVKT